MAKLVIKNIKTKLTDSTICDMAKNFCIPAFYEYIYRYKLASPSSQKAKQMLRTIKTLHKKFEETHKNFSSLHLILMMPTNKILEEARKLTLISEKLYQAPVRSLVNSFNSEYLNKRLISQRLGYKIDHIVEDLNKGNFRFEDNKKLNNRTVSQLFASILYVNWFLIKPVYKRPIVGYMKYFFKPQQVQSYVSETFSKFYKSLNLLTSYDDSEYVKSFLNKKSSELYVTLSSDKLANFLHDTSKSKINTLMRLYKAIHAMNLVEKKILERLPTFVILNDLAYSDLSTLIKLEKIGYNRVLHLKFLEDEVIETMKNRKLQKILLKSSNQ